ncbi:MAG: hypothetical protein LUO98_06440 [Methanoregula sp.]|nr:hypothetical protein [Methanoregula sp.]
MRRIYPDVSFLISSPCHTNTAHWHRHGQRDRGITALLLAFIGAAVLFLPLLLFPGILQDPKEKKNATAYFELSKVVRLER